jgi:hypothetical protein
MASEWMALERAAPLKRETTVSRQGKKGKIAKRLLSPSKPVDGFVVHPLQSRSTQAHREKMESSKTPVI